MTVVLLLFGSNMLRAQTTAINEPQIKAVFLFNFTQFVEWPASAFPDDQTPLTIGILGKDPFGANLGQAIQNEKINNHPLILKHYSSADEIKNCHILFINLSNKDELAKTFTALKGSNTLTVGDTRSFIRDGGMIRFFNENDKIKIQINTDVTKAAGLTISSKLLRLAEIVTK